VMVASNFIGIVAQNRQQNPLHMAQHSCVHRDVLVPCGLETCC
jgi:hypothetical protein